MTDTQANIADQVLHIAGSASPNCSGPSLGLARQFVREVVSCWAEARGRFVVFLGREPRQIENDPSTSLIFDWLVLEVLAEKASKATPSLSNPLCTAFLSVESRAQRFPADRETLVNDLLKSGLLTLEFIDEAKHTGGFIRQQICSHSDVLVALGGGKGVYDFGCKFQAGEKPVIALDVQIGSSCNDGEGALAISKDALLRPDAWFPSLPASSVRNVLVACSLQRDNAEVSDVAENVVNLAHRALDARSVAVPPSALRVLFVAASPKDQTTIDLNSEAVSLLEIAQDMASDNLLFRVLRDATVDKLRKELTRCKPHILSLSCHGNDQGVAICQDDLTTHFVDLNGLKALLSVYDAHLRIVVLNACDSAPLAIAVSESIDFCIGMKASIPDDTAIAFSQGVLEGLSGGLSVRKSVDLGRANAKAKALPDSDLPVLHCRAGTDPDIRLPLP
jgi:hypothetical protein